MLPALSTDKDNIDKWLYTTLLAPRAVIVEQLQVSGLPKVGFGQTFSKRNVILFRSISFKYKYSK